MRILAIALFCAASLLASGELSGRRAPGFSLSDSAGKQQDPQNYRGKYVLVEFMQTTCPHCAGFAKVLEEVSTKYAGKLAVLSVAVQEPGQNVLRFMASHKITYPMMIDCGQVATSYYKATPANPSIAFPHIFLIDPQGVIRNDFGYNLLNRDIFEGRGLFRELDRIFAAPAKK